ncbi:PVC-type heme-binding CxxCH protein [Roseimaritima ulvae]|uniref:Neutral/alkaline non-lysosomal ceramidase n=1 Tax=Roseimaritima ulvae TaxID=980254 RepID=A0A5B9R0S0_9BACT|nr:PVC-type heme-binding CxxCH protein [Roseimaritima ulvae]QEG39873.1 Neutral/alkaline non-lysosomal ceramidase [Roseimaritima ulvae]
MKMLLSMLLIGLLFPLSFASAENVLRAGAASVDISPRSFPAIRNGGFLEATGTEVADPLHARCLVLADGKETIAITIVDSCMFPTDICDAIKSRVTERTGLPADRILISATHTHSAPSVMSYCLGTRSDQAYTEYVVPRVAEAIVTAHEKLQPARIGWTAVDAGEQTNCRRWITRSDRMGTDPFGQRTVRAMMHPGYLNPDYVSPAGPIDPQLSLLSVVAADDTPLCLLANFSMHYFGHGSGFSADYFGEVAGLLESGIAATADQTPSHFVGIMSQGTSGDLHWMDYGKPRRRVDRTEYAKTLAETALTAWKQIQHRSDITIAMAESRMKLRRRIPDARRLAWARPINEQRGDAPPKNRTEVYAQQAQWIHEHPEAEVVLQALRIGDLAITALPNEVYGITGLKLKQQSPLVSTFNLELANGAEGYIPPPEQHRLGGYTTWPARTAGLEVEAEPKIVEKILTLLESVSGKPRRVLVDPPSAFSLAVMKAQPTAYWRLGDMVVDQAVDATGQHPAKFDGGVALYLQGPDLQVDSTTGKQDSINRCVYFAGGSLQANVAQLPSHYSLSMWFWNGLPAGSEDPSAALFSRGAGAAQESLSIVSTDEGLPVLAFRSGGTAQEHSEQHVGSTPLVTKAWHHVTVVRDAEGIRIFLDGKARPELATSLRSAAPASAEFSFGNFDGKLDEIALFARIVSVDEMVDIYRASNMKAPQAPPQPLVLGEKPSDDGALKRYAEGIQKSQPVTYWRLHDRNRNAAHDEQGEHDGRYEPRSGPRKPGALQANFSGGRMLAKVPNLDHQYSVEFWFCNQLPHTHRPVTGYLFTRGLDGAHGAPGDSLGIGGTHASLGRLLLYNGNQRGELLSGKTMLATNSWNHVVLTRDANQVQVFLNGKLEIDGQLNATYPDGCPQIQIGGRNDNFANFQGMIDEVAVYDRTLSADEAQTHFAIAGTKPLAQTKTLAQAKVESPQEPEPTASAASLEKIHIRDGFEVQLVASEPLIKDPVAIDWGLDGKLWVVEMADYPLGMDGAGEPGGRIRVLEDQDGDGRYDSSTLFAEGLRFPNGLLVWGNGVLVTAAPEILYLEDSTGDGKADIRRRLFNGFLEGNQQLRVNGLRWGLDNWVHCASGSHHSGYGKGNQITSVLTGQSHRIGSRDFRIRPDSGDIEPQSGPSQYGRNRDDWGNWFGVQNSLPLWHYVLADQDIRRNPHFAPPDPKHQVVTPSNPLVYPAAQLQKRFHNFDQSGRFTSACSAIIYRDNVLFPRGENQQHAFTCEPFHNLVQHNIITDDGVSFDFHRDPAEPEFDFFASQDRWCRPVMARTGPDGALWIVDMYRYMIEHPQWLPQAGKDELRPYYRLGENHGRIYRVVPEGKSLTTPPIANSTTGMLAALASSNGWQRDVAQRYFAHGNDAAALLQIESLATAGESPVQRLQALCTLDGMQNLSTDVLQTALQDPHAGVRRQAVRLAALHAVDIQQLRPLVKDPSVRVRLQLAATLGAYDDPLAAQLLAQLAVESAGDVYILANVMSSLNQGNIADVLTATIAMSSDETASSKSQRRLQQQLFGQVAALGDTTAIGHVVAKICKAPDGSLQPWQLAGLADLLDGLTKRKFALNQLSADQQDLIQQAIEQARAAVAQTPQRLSPQTEASLRLLLRQDKVYADDLQRLSNLLVPQSAVELQWAVVDRLALQDDSQIAEVLLAPWQSYGPSLRSRVLDVLASRTQWSRVLLTAVQSRRVSSGEVSPSLRERLLATKDQALKDAWTAAFTATTTQNRKLVIERYQAALTLTGEVERGRKVFATSCAACHKLGTVGHNVGPDLASITDKRPATLLANILDPSAEVEARYLTYIVVTDDGRVHNGLLATETGSSITLLSNDGKRETILRTEIEELRASGKSLMPEGLEKDLSPQAVADLIAWLTAKPKPNH